MSLLHHLAFGMSKMIPVQAVSRHYFSVGVIAAAAADEFDQRVSW